MDISTVLQNLLNFVAGIAVVLSVAVIIAGVALRARGHPRANDLVLYGFMGLLISLFGYPLVVWIYGGYVPEVPGIPTGTWSLLLHSISAVMVTASAIYIALGRVEEGAWSLVGAVAVIGLVGLGMALVSGSVAAPQGAVPIEIAVSKPIANCGEELALRARVSGVSADVLRVEVLWNDGKVSDALASPGEWAEFRHVYSCDSLGGEPARSFTIFVNIYSSELLGYNTVSVTVLNPGYCPLSWPFNALCGFARWVSGIPIIGAVAVVDFQKLVMSPTFPTDPSDFLYQTYSNLMNLSLLGFGLFLALSMAWSAISREAPAAIVSSVKDATVALLLALLAPHIYNATAGIINTVALGFVGYGYAVQGAAIAVYSIAAGLAAAIGYFVPYLANVAAFATILMIIGNLVVNIRWAIMLAIVTSSPLLALAYIHPALRGVVRHVIGLLAGLMLAGPMAAIALAVLGYMLPGQEWAVAVLFPIFAQVAPTLLGAFGGGVAAELGGAVVGGARTLTSRATRAVPATQAVQAGQQRIRVPAPRAATAQPGIAAAAPTAARARVRAPLAYRPVITRADIRKAAEEAKMSMRVAEGLRVPEHLGAFVAEMEAERVAAERAWQRMDAFAKEVLADTRLQRAAGREAAEAARAAYEALLEEEKQKALLEAPKPGALKVHPRWEAFKTFTAELSRRAARQLWINTKGMLKEYGYGLAREAGARIPRSYGGRGTTRVSRDPLQYNETIII